MYIEISKIVVKFSRSYIKKEVIHISDIKAFRRYIQKDEDPNVTPAEGQTTIPDITALYMRYPVAPDKKEYPILIASKYEDFKAFIARNTTLIEI